MNLVFESHKPVERIFDFLTDMKKFVSVHPVIKRIDHLPGNNYLIHETLKFGFIPFTFTYKATVDQNFNEKKIKMQAKIMTLATIQMNYTLTRDETCTIIHEKIHVISPSFVKSIIKNILKKQHSLLFQNIEALKS